MYDPRAIADDLDGLLTSGFGPNAAATELDCLALATCYDKEVAEHAAHAKLAKKVLKKHASQPVQAALSKVTRRNYYPKRHTTDAGFRKTTERLGDFADLAQIAGFDVAGYAGRLVSLDPRLLNNLLAGRDLAFLDAYFRRGHPSDELTFDDLDHPGGWRYDHTFTPAELEVLAGIPRFTRLEVRCEGKKYPLPKDMSAWSKLEVLEVRSKASAPMSQARADALGALPALRELHLDMPLTSMAKDLSSWGALRALRLTNTALPELPDAFAALTELRRLEVRQAPQMKTLRDGVGGMTRLEVLVLSSVGLESCSPRLGDLKNLRELELTGLRDSADVFAVLGELSRLERLKIASMEHVVALPDAIGRLTALEVLVIKDLSKVEVWFSGLENLTRLVELRLRTLGRWGGGLEDPLVGVGALENLEVLEVADTSLGRPFPDGLTRCTRLRELSLGDSYLGAPPDDLGALTELEVLDLKTITFEAWPETFFELRNLEHLRLGGHRGYIPPLPDEVRNFTELEHLDLEGSRTRALPEGICALKNLRRIELGLNPFERFPEGFATLTNLEAVGGTGSKTAAVADQLEQLREAMPWCDFWNWC